jgi:hypothetical protein
VQDHPYQPAHLDAWTLLTHVAARTERVTVFPNVANLPHATAGGRALPARHRHLTPVRRAHDRAIGQAHALRPRLASSSARPTGCTAASRTRRTYSGSNMTCSHEKRSTRQPATTKAL